MSFCSSGVIPYNLLVNVSTAIFNFIILSDYLKEECLLRHVHEKQHE